MLRGLAYVFLLLTTSACGASPDSDESRSRLPYAQAPLDTLDRIEAVPASDTTAPVPTGILADSGWADVRLPGLPGPGELSYVRYTNEAYGYSLAYPDTLLRPSEPVGEGRGMTFASPSGDVRMMVYAAEREGYENLDAQYTAVIEDGESIITYRARDERFYVVSGRSGEHIFYEKAVANEASIVTFRIRYPSEKKTYYDAVTALIAASLRTRRL